MSIFSFYLISKSGSLLYQKDFDKQDSPISKQNSNDYLVIASTLHGVHAIASKLTPVEAMENYEKSRLPTNSNRFGLQCITTENFKIFIHQTTTGLKLILFSSNDVPQIQAMQLQGELYKCYADYVLKNPFYRLDMPIRFKLFDDMVVSVVRSYNA